MTDKVRRWGVTFLSLSFLFFAVSLFAMIFRMRITPLTPQILVGMVMELMGMALMAVFLNGSLHEEDVDPLLSMRFITFVFSVFCALSSDFWVWATDTINDPRAMRISYIANDIYFLANTAVIHTFAIYLKGLLPRWPSWATLFHVAMRVYYGLLVLGLVLNRRYGILYTITDGVYCRGPLVIATFVISGIFAAALAVLVAIQQIDRTEKASMLFYILLPAGAMIPQMLLTDFSYTPMSMILATTILYVDGHVRQSRLLQQQRLQAQQQQTALTLSQLQPHFLYNTLTSAACLCRKDPLQAEAFIMDFAGYLRSNLTALKSDAPLPFAHELEYIRAYLNIEQVRFADSLQVVYQIESDNFLIPSLTVQPLVENAVKHGIRKREDGGTVTISSQELPDRWTVMVADTGIGFDPDTVDWESGTHVGLVNVLSRLQAYGNQLTLESRPGEGTTVTITIPKKKEVSP